MANKNFTMKEKTDSGYDVLYPKTTADQVVTSSEKGFISDEERAKINGVSGFKSCIRLLEGNLMRENGTVLSLSPYDIQKASTYNANTKQNTTDPSTVPSTVLVFYKTLFVDPGFEVYDKNGKLINTSVTVKVTDINNNVLKTVNNYKGGSVLSTSDAINVNKEFKTYAEGTFKIKYIATIDGVTNSDNTYVRYVKLRYLRGDCNADGIIDTEDYDAVRQYSSGYMGTYGLDDEVGLSVCDVNRDGTCNSGDINTIKSSIEGKLEYWQDFIPYGITLDLGASKSRGSHDHRVIDSWFATKIGYEANANAYGTALGCMCDTNGKGAAIAKGDSAVCERWNEEARNVDGGGIYYSTVVWNGTLTTPVMTEIFLGGSSGQRCKVLDNSAMNFKIIATCFDGTGCKTYEIKGTIRRTGSTALSGSVSTTLSMDSSVSACEIVVEADDTNSALILKAKGSSAGVQVRWVARGELTEIRI